MCNDWRAGCQLFLGANPRALQYSILQSMQGVTVQEANKVGAQVNC
jgi:hypothetical protein